MIKKPKYKNLYENLTLKIQLTSSTSTIDHIFEVLDELMVLYKDTILKPKIQEFLAEFLKDIGKLRSSKNDALEEVNSYFSEIKKHLSGLGKISGLLAYDILHFEGLPAQDVYQRENVLVEIVQNLLNDKSVNHYKFLDGLGIFQKSKRFKNLEYEVSIRRHESHTEINIAHLQECIHKIQSYYTVIENFTKIRNLNVDKFLSKLVIIQNLEREKAAIIILDAYLRVCYSTINSLLIHLQQTLNSDWFELASQLGVAEELFLISLPKFNTWSNMVEEFKMIEKKCTWYPFSRLAGFWLYKHKQLANSHPFRYQPTLNFPEFWNELVYNMPGEISVDECKYLMQRLLIDSEAYLIKLDSRKTSFWLYPEKAEVIIDDNIINFEIGRFPFATIEKVCTTKMLSMPWDDIQEDLIDTPVNSPKNAKMVNLTHMEKQSKHDRNTSDKRKIRDAVDCAKETIAKQSGVTDFVEFSGGNVCIDSNEYKYMGIISVRLRNKLMAIKNATK